MATVVLALGTIYLVVSSISRLAWPIRRLSNPVLDAKWQKALYAAIYGSFALNLVAWLLLFTLPGRLLWIPLALVIIGLAMRNHVIRVTMRHARPGESGESDSPPGCINAGLQRN